MYTPGIMSDQRILSTIKEIKEVTDEREMARLLSSGDWIATYAVENKDFIIFVLGRIH